MKQRQFRVLELFAGSRSIGKVAEHLGMRVLSVDLYNYGGIHRVGDIMSMRPKSFKDWDIIWASPPCTAFSVASIGRHWMGGARQYQPKSADAYLGQALVKRTQEIIAANPRAIWFVENPRGVLRKLPMMQGFGTHHTVTYCQYGDVRMKPTDIWTNCTTWVPKPMCRNGQSCHEPAPRGSRTGTQGLKGAHERAVIPPALCMDVLSSAMEQLQHMAGRNPHNDTSAGPSSPARERIANT